MRAGDRFNSIFLPTGGEWIPSTGDGRPITLGSGLDYRDRPTVLMTDCDRERETLYHWNTARREAVIHLFCNQPDKKLIEAHIKAMKKEHGEVSGVTVYVDPQVFRDDLVLVERMGFERATSRERAEVPYLVLWRTEK
jgi:hypothetical protein